MNNTIHRERLSIVEEPQGDTYRALLRFLKTYSDGVLLVVRDPTNVSFEVQKVLGRLDPMLRSEADEHQWPGTTLIGHTAHIYRYDFSERCLDLLCSSVGRLYDWISPDRPEDLSIVSGATALLTTISHEREGYLDLTVAEHAALTQSIPGMVIYSGELMPTGAEPFRLFGAFLDTDSLASDSVEAALARYVSMASPNQIEEVVATIREATFTLKDEVLIRQVLKRWGASANLVGRRKTSAVLNEIADHLERQAVGRR